MRRPGSANAAKYFAAEAGFAATQAVMTHGGMGYAKEYHVERLLHEALIPRLARQRADGIELYRRTELACQILLTKNDLVWSYLTEIIQAKIQK